MEGASCHKDGVMGRVNTFLMVELGQFRVVIIKRVLGLGLLTSRSCDYNKSGCLACRVLGHVHFHATHKLWIRGRLRVTPYALAIFHYCA